MSRIFVNGVGAVSPAGWDVASLLRAMDAGASFPGSELPGPGPGRAARVRRVPPPQPRPAFLAHPRMRRTSPVSWFATAAALEAVRPPSSHSRLGVVAAVTGGCVNYSRRFFEEVLRDPATSSPLIFPETVFNAPASHIGAVLGTSAPNYTLVGDDGAFVQGLDLAAGWLLEDRVDACLVVAAEEADWLTAEAIRLFDPRGVPAEGAGALLLTREPSGAIAELSRVTHAHGFATSVERVRAARRMRAEVTLADARAVLLDGTTGTSADPAETQAWSDWNGERRSPLRGTGMAFTASAAWLCVLAVEACRASRPAVASVVGVNRQAIAAMFIPVGE